MPKYTSNRQRNLKIGITSYTDSLTVLEVTGGAYISSSVGIGTTVASQSLHVQGNARISGAVYDSTNVSGTLGQVLQSTATGTIWANSSVVGVPSYSDRAGIATYADRAGIATYATNAGVATYAQTAGIATYATIAGYSTSSGIATYAQTAGIATYATSAGVATYAGYASTAGIATYATNAGVATYSTNAGIATYATSSGIATYAINAGIATNANYAGIATYAINAGIATNVIGGIASVRSLSVSGISTLGTIQVSSGIISATSGIVSYFGDGAGLINIQASAIVGGAGYVDYAGVSTSVIGGIASVRSLSVSGVSTLGTVLITSSGIVTAAIGIVTYYGDGSNLIGISSVGNQLAIIDKSGVSSPIYPTLANNAGNSDVGISSSKLSFIPSTNKLGVGTGVPRENIDVVGTIGIQSAGSSNRFYLQHNPSQSSIDFIFV